MVDANQKWEVQEAIDWMKQMADYKILWIEEPTNPDDVMGHAAIAEVRGVQCHFLYLHTCILFLRFICT